MARIKDGTVKHASAIDFTGDLFNRKAEDGGYYVWFGMWKGPFSTQEQARDAYREWAFEARHS